MLSILLYFQLMGGAEKIVERGFAQSFGIGVLTFFCLAVCTFCYNLWKQQNKRERETMEIIIKINSEMLQVLSENTSAISKLQQSIDFMVQHSK